MEKRANIKVVAELAGVSISTVSRVLNQSASVSSDLTEKVHKAIRDTGYSINPIASTLKSTRRNQMAIVVPSLRQTYYTDIIKGISDYCYERGVLPLILESSGEPEKEEKIIDNLEKQWVDGIIFIQSKNAKEEKGRKFAASLSKLKKNQEKIPVVLMEAESLNGEVDCIRIDYEYAFFTLVSHLLEIGRRRIAFLCGPTDSSTYEMTRKGVARALQEYGHTLEESYLIEGKFTVLEGYSSMNELLGRGIPIDGVVCANDQMASGALWACCEKGIRVPQDIAITGFGGVALSIITTPSITTMIAPRYELGYRAAELLFERVDGVRDTAEHVVIRPHIAIRGSTLKSAYKTLDSMFEE